MNLARSAAVAISLLAHGSFGYAVTHRPAPELVTAYQKGTGSDIVNVEKGIAIEGLANLGNEEATVQTAEQTPIEAVPPPPAIQEIKPQDELRDVLTAKTSLFEDNIVKTEEAPPPVQETKPPQVVQAEEQPKQVALYSEQSSGAAKTAADSTARSEYLGKLSNVIQRAKVNPRTRAVGEVVVRLKIDKNGKVLTREIASSSGLKALEEAAFAAVDRAEPFPAMPLEVAEEQLVVTIPFKFVTR